MTQSISGNMPPPAFPPSINAAQQFPQLLSHYSRHLGILSTPGDVKRVFTRLTKIDPQADIHINFPDSRATITSNVFTIESLQSAVPQNWRVRKDEDDAVVKFTVKITDPDNQRTL